MEKLVYVNLFGTLLPEAGEPIARKGARKFLESLDRNHSAVYSYQLREDSVEALEAAELFDAVPRLYGFEEMGKYNVLTSPGSGFSIAVMPDLSLWSRIEFRSRENHAIVISDKPWDIDDAYWCGAVSIQVPTYKDNSDNFSFDRVKPYSVGTKLSYAIQDFMFKPRKINMR